MNISRQDVWLVNLDPTLGAEIRKTRPVIVVNSDSIGILPIRLVAPLTAWKDVFAHNVWHLKIDPTTENGLNKRSAVDLLQLRGVDVSRFDRKLGRVPDRDMKIIVNAIANVVEYLP